MKALSISQPWVWAILNAGKRIENRDWNPPKWIMGETIAIHAAKSWGGADDVEYIDSNIFAMWLRYADPTLQELTCPPRREQHTAGAVVATARIIDIFTDQDIREVGGHQDDWFMGKYGWLLSDVQQLEQPVPCKGALGLWEVPLDVLAQIGVQK
jgi:hypothetical protein